MGAQELMTLGRLKHEEMYRSATSPSDYYMLYRDLSDAEQQMLRVQGRIPEQRPVTGVSLNSRLSQSVINLRYFLAHQLKSLADKLQPTLPDDTASIVSSLP